MSVMNTKSMAKSAVKYGKAGGAICLVSSVIAVVTTNFSDRIRSTERGLEIIGNAEGCRRNAYQCPADVLTVGIGSTEAGGEKIERNRTYTDLEIADRWTKDIQKAEACVNRYASGWSMPLSTFEALTSITFNVGCGAMRRSTMFRKANVADWKGICNEFPKWVYAGGKKLRGLEIRREKEKALCLMDLTKSS